MFVFLWASTCPLITLTRCLEGLKTIILFFCMSISKVLSELVSESVTLSCSGQLKMQDFCTKMKFPPLYMIFRGTGDGQHYLVGFLSLLSPQARGASVMSLQFQSVCNGICDEISGPRLRSYQAIFTDQGHINKVIPVSECLKLFFNKIFGKC